jgi:hypothetical protein
MVLTIALLIIGLATAFAAIHGLVRGTVYCKGGPYSRAARPVAFWASVISYLLWKRASPLATAAQWGRYASQGGRGS